MFLVRSNVVGEKLGRLDRGSNDTVSAQALFHAIPIHVVLAEDVGQSPKRHVDFSEKKRLFDVVGECRVVRHYEGRSNSVRNGIHGNSPYGYLQFFRTPGLLHPVSVADFVGEELGIFIDELVQYFPELFGIFDCAYIFLDRREERLYDFSGELVFSSEFSHLLSFFRLSLVTQP